MRRDLIKKEYLIFPVSEDQFCVWEFEMEKYDSTPLLKLGYAIGGLLKSLTSALGEDSSFAAIRLKSRLKSFINQNKDESQFKHSINAADLVIGCIDDYIEEEKKQQKKPTNNSSAYVQRIDAPFGVASVSSGLVSSKEVLISVISDLQTFLEAEIPQLNIFCISKHRAYDMSTLIDNGENLLSPNTLKSLGVSKPEVINDIRETAKSLAFGLYTAVGFHLFRAIEAIAVDEYLPLLSISVEEYKANCPNLGNCVGILKGDNGKFKVNTPVDVRITSMLDHITKKYRNPIMHPDAIWDQDEANGAIGLAVSIIDMMAQDIDEIRKKVSSEQPS